MDDGGIGNRGVARDDLSEYFQGFLLGQISLIITNLPLSAI